MAYVKTTWVDQEGQVRYTETEDDGYKVFTPNFEEVTELGTPVDAVHLNNIENGIDGTAIRKHNLTETFNLNECVLGGTAGKEIIYRSLVANNVGNAVTDTTKWKKARICTGRNIGELVYSSLPLTDEDLHLADGSLVSNTDYADFVSRISYLYNKGLHNVDMYAYNDRSNFTGRTAYVKVLYQEGVFAFNEDNEIIGIVTDSFSGMIQITETGGDRHNWYRYTAGDTVIQESYNCFTSENDWQNCYTTYGECGKYVYDSEDNTVRLPLYNSYLTNTADVDLLGNLTPASIPNIKGEGILQDDVSKCSGAIYFIDSVSSTNSEPGGSSSKLMGFDASKSSAIYSDSATTVNTQSIKQLVYIVVAE